MGLELTKVAKRDGQEFDCATWLHKARSLPKDQFKREVEKELTGRESEPWEIIYFKLYKTQIPIVGQGGSELGQRRPNRTTAVDITVFQIPAWRTTAGISRGSYREGFVNRIRPKRPRLRLDPDPYDQLRKQILRRDG